MRRKRVYSSPVASVYPAEDTAVFAVHGCHNLGCVPGAPLREQMGDFKEPHPHAVAHINPAIQLIKAEAVRPVRDRHVQQLHRGAFAADRRIQRRREERRQQQVDAVLHRRAGKILHDAPMPFRPRLTVVVIGKAVAVEPLRDLHRLLGQIGVQHLNGQRCRCQHLVPALKTHRHGVHPGGYRVARVKANPDCVQLSAQNRYGTTVMHRAQPVRVQPRFAAQVVRIHRQHLGGRGINDRLQFHRPHSRAGGERALDRQRRHGTVRIVLRVQCEEQLKGQALVFHHPDRGQRLKSADVTVKEGFFEGRYNLYLVHDGLSFLSVSVCWYGNQSPISFSNRSSSAGVRAIGWSPRLRRNSYGRYPHETLSGRIPARHAVM